MTALAAHGRHRIALPRPEATGDDYFDLQAAVSALEDGRPVAFPPFELVHWGGLTWALNFRNDPIQSRLRNGRFYEADELEVLRAALGPGARIADIGSNIGNHAVYFATRMQAARVVVVEPNPLALAPLIANILMNRLTGIVCTDLLGVGLSDRPEGGFAMRRHDRNLGATRMTKGQPGGHGGFEVHPGDDLLGDEQLDLIKLDVEGMELRVLDGLRQTVARCRPLMLVEVLHQNLGGFEAWCAEMGYVRRQTWTVGEKNANHLIEPAEGRPGPSLPGPAEKEGT